MDSDNSIADKEKLGEILIRTGVITTGQLRDALKTGRKTNKLIGQVLIDNKLITPRDLVTVLSIQQKSPLKDITRNKILPGVLSLVPENLARKHNIIPLDIIGDYLTVVVTDIEDTDAINDLTSVVGKRIEPIEGAAEDIRKAIDLNYAVKNEEVHKSHKKNALIIPVICLVILCIGAGFYILFSSLKVSTPQMVTPVPQTVDSNPRTVDGANVGYLYDRVINWADGSSEHIQIDKEGFFHIDGTKKNLVGMYLSKRLPYGDVSGQFYLPENLAFLDKELTYLESAGIRLVRIELPYLRWWLPDVADEKAAYSALLDLIYKHRMLVIPGIYSKWIGGFNDLETPDFYRGLQINGKWVPDADSLGKWAERWVEVVKKYPNVVAVCAENELDYKLKAADYSWLEKDQRYTAERVADYMTFLTGILRQVDVPITHNLMANRIEPEIKQVCLESIDIPAFDCYENSSERLDTVLTDFLPWVGVTDGWWCLELNYRCKTCRYWDVAGFNNDYIDTIFNHGGRVAILFWSSDAVNPQCGFFDNNGDPKQELIQIVSEIERLQAPIGPTK